MKNIKINISHLHYFGPGGLKNLANRLTGTETIHIGIRPYGLHAGNELVLFCYPYLLACEMIAQKKIPRFKILISLNDWEAYHLNYKIGEDFPYNIFPEDYTFQFIRSELNADKYVCDVLEEQLTLLIKERFLQFPEIEFFIIRNSALKQLKEFSRILAYTLLYPQEIANNINNVVQSKIIVDKDIKFAGAVCPACYHTNVTTQLIADNEIIKLCLECNVCQMKMDGGLMEFDFWMHFLPLRIARLAALKFQIHITGADHLITKDIYTIHSLKTLMKIHAKEPFLLVTPLLVDNNNIKISKRNGLPHSEPKDYENLLSFARTANESITMLPNNKLKI